MANDEKLVEYLKWTTAELLQAQTRVRELEEERREPIAIVGMACRFPGGVRTPDELWTLVDGDQDAITSFPADRGWDLDDVHEPGWTPPPYPQLGGFIEDVFDFDATFFGMNARQALATEPQQRALLEVAWEAIENAGIDPTRLRDTDTAVYAGATAHGYAAGLESIPPDLLGYLGNGAAGSLASGRLAFSFGLQGAAVSLDTGCSSALVAAHLACTALRRGECGMALAGGVGLLYTPAPIALSATGPGMMAPDGRCKPFSDASDGMVYGEGAGMLLLQRLRDARRDGRRILGVIRGSAVNQDGQSTGLSAPSGPSRQRVIRAALEDAGLAPGDVDAVEGHGTGTAMGDLIEAQATLATYGQERGEDGRPVWLGTIKPHIGHTQAAAGVAGIIKMIMALRHETLPATLNIGRPSPQVSWSSGAVRLLTERVGWPRGERPRRCGISAFSASGTNAHVVLEEPPAAQAGEAGKATAAGRPVAQVSAGPAAMGRADAVEAPEPEESLEPVAGTGLRGVVPLVLSARSAEALRCQARAVADLMAAGDGASPAAVGRSLATTRSVFEHRATVAGADRDELLAGLDALATGAGHPALVTSDGPVTATMGGTAFVLGADTDDVGADDGIAELRDAFPAFAAAFEEAAGQLGQDAGHRRARRFALRAGLVRLLATAGIHPGAVISFPDGAIEAALAAGTVDLPEACRLLLAEDTERTAAALAAGRQATPVISGLTGERVTTAEEWAAHLGAATRTPDDATPVELGAAGGDLAALLELGSERALPALAPATRPGRRPPLRLAVAPPGQPAVRGLTHALARLHATGTAVAWGALLDTATGTAVPLPTYPFQRSRYWLHDEAAPRRRTGNAAAPHWYRVAWQALPDVPAPRLTGRWLLVSPPGDLADAVATALRRHGAEVAVIESKADGTPDDGAAPAARLGEALALGPAAGVLSLLALDDQDPGTDAAGDATPYPAAEAPHLAPTEALAAALAASKDPAPLWIATRGAVAARSSGAPPRPAQAQLWHAGGDGLVDLPGRFDDRTGRWLAATLAAGGEDGEREVAVRVDGRYARRLVRHAPAEPGAGRLTGTVLLTGADTTLGGHAARRLADAGAAHLLLTGADTDPSPDLIAELAAQGVTATVVPAAGLADRAALDRLVAGLPERHPLTAAVHLGPVLAAGTDGAWPQDVAVAARLCALAEDRTLSALVLCTSAAGLLAANPGPGRGGQGGAAHAHLDALAGVARSRGVPAVSLSLGVQGLPAEAAAEALRQAAASAGTGPAASVLYADLDGERAPHRPVAHHDHDHLTAPQPPA
ncbi:type I polyketide synthase [Streptomyces sp. ME19-01-6]|uniref:type I polyketide synthase n=1 Tax=Streptomyces sp. ME19-01-6 TaxID=3028686 RepID=UPI0029BED481|nr:beta-ketoacyl synthase N-terminal-like domain-containing protein [Streptomyces sp. ME19-01-6]MDX3233936.1 beta-ketoacyl synthase N-terminal-like domain-containing protein [Streptomyces sp. ME19-01-6]